MDGSAPARAPLLQLALDGALDDGLRVLESLHPLVDIVEAGTPLVLREGMRAVRALRGAFPDHRLLADLKIADAGELGAALAFEAGADLVTVLGGASDATVRGAVRSARAAGGAVVADMIGLPDPAGRGARLLELGVDRLCVHTAHDLRAEAVAPLADLRRLRAAFAGASLAIAGGIDLAALDAILPLRPDAVVVGGAICAAADPFGSAAALRERLGRAPARGGAGVGAARYRRRLARALEEFEATLAGVGTADVEAFPEAIRAARRIFVAGRGRSELQMRGFAMRLMHLGFEAHVVGDATTPAIGGSDLLLLGSGSGATASLLGLADAARTRGARVALIGGAAGAPLARRADVVLVLPAPSPKRPGADAPASLLPLGSRFELSLALLCELLVLRLMELTGTDEAAMFARHANLE